jgi:hypothetical protein
LRNAVFIWNSSGIHESLMPYCKWKAKLSSTIPWKWISLSWRSRIQTPDFLKYKTKLNPSNYSTNSMRVANKALKFVNHIEKVVKLSFHLQQRTSRQ